MLDSLKIISIDRIVSFEQYSKDHASRLASNIKRLGVLKNPLLVYPFYDKYLLLDDASLLHSLNLMNINHVPAQIADENQLSIRPWQRIVEGLKREDLIKFCDKFPRQIKLNDKPSGQPNDNEIEVWLRNDGTLRLDFVSDSYLVRADLLTKFFEEFGRSYKNYRTILEYGDTSPWSNFPNASAIIYPLNFTIEELAGMVSRGAYLPRGLLRVDLPGRILGIDYALAILKEEATQKDKEAFLKELIHMRMTSDRTVYYFGNVFLFNN